jgi:methionyl-tRNA formyltransferase
MRILIVGDGPWAANTLLHLVEAGHDIAAVVLRKRPSDESLEKAARSLELKILQPEQVNADAFVKDVQDMDIELGISIACDQIMRRPLLGSTRHGFVNFHAGMLPRYRGRNIINWAIINGESEIGLTAHLVDEGIDTGNTILQKTLPIEWTDTYGDVLRRIVDSFPDFVVDAVGLIDSQSFKAQPQNGQGTYFCGREDGDEWLDWSATSFDLYNKVRGISRPGPGARTLLGDKTVIVWNAAYDLTWPKYMSTPGQVVGRNEDGVTIKSGDSTILIKEVQIEDGPSEKPTWPIGTRLGVDQFRIILSLQNRIRDLEAQILSGARTI